MCGPSVEQQTDRMCGPYSKRTEGRAELTATHREVVGTLQQDISRMCKPYNNKSKG
jgi:hypothetical protein